jgi:hypothetical protein
LAGEGGSGYITVAVSWHDVSARKLKYAFLVITYSALFDNVLEALNLLLIIPLNSVTKIQLPGNGIRLLSRTHTSS